MKPLEEYVVVKKGVLEEILKEVAELKRAVQRRVKNEARLCHQEPPS